MQSHYLSKNHIFLSSPSQFAQISQLSPINFYQTSNWSSHIIKCNYYFSYCHHPIYVLQYIHNHNTYKYGRQEITSKWDVKLFRTLTLSTIPDELNWKIKKMQQNYSYTKIKCLFKGYAGKVFLIEKRSENDPPNKQTGSLVLKRYYRKASDPENHTNLIEYKLLTSLQHPNIVNIIDAFTEQYEYKKYLCLTMEYMAPLHQIIGNLKDHQLYIFKEICQAVSYLHSNNTLHRDIKPSNIFVTTQGRVKLGDFGISTQIRQSMTPQTCTKNYRAPELFFGLKEYDHSIDVWSLGCTLIELFTGKMLFNGNSEIEIMSQMAELLGSVNEQNWEGVSQLPMFLEFVYDKQPLLEKVIGRLPIQVQSLLIKILQLNPKARLKINEILLYLDELQIPDRSRELSYIAQNTLRGKQMNQIQIII